jgi:GNAT superfamily N-acetyltransferase
MIRYRPFLNSDPPAIAAIWCSQPPSWGLMQPISPAILDQLVLAKPYFDRQGLIMAIEDGQPVGFVHAGFGPNANRSGLDFEVGATYLLMVDPDSQRSEIASELLARSEEYLRRSGARQLYGGAVDRLGPFYLGLYGGSISPGVLLSDQAQMEAFRAAGYVEDHRALILHRDLAGFRPPVDHQTLQWRRQFSLVACTDLQPADWWDACVFSQIDRLCLTLSPRTRGPDLGEACFWDMEPMASTWGVHAMGLLRQRIHSHPQDGPDHLTLTIHLLAEAIRNLQSCGVKLVEVQVDCADELLSAACQKLGFREVNQGIRFRKPVAP